jgi:hypothetical protein
MNEDKKPDKASQGNDAKGAEKPKTEQASHQGGGGVRSDHKPRGPGAKK